MRLMKSMSLMAVLSVAILHFSLIASAQESCLEVFSASSDGIALERASAAAQPLTAFAPNSRALSSRVREILNQHALNDLARSLEYGSDLFFHFESGFLPDGHIDPYAKGEALQSLRVYDYLRYLFPRAGFSHLSPSPGDTRKRIRILVGDLSEDAMAKRELFKNSRDIVLTMPLLKVASATEILLPSAKRDVRKAWGLGEKARIVSLYVREPEAFYGRGGVRFAELLASIEKSYKYDVLLVSFGNHSSAIDPLSFVASHVGRVGRLNEIIATNQSPGEGKAVVLNDTQGKMREVHAAADLAIVTGAINFFEPIASGTPTVVLMHPQFTFGYEAATLKDLLETARKTGLATSAETLDGLSQAITDAQSFDASRATPPAFVDSPQSPIRQLMDKIKMVIESQYSADHRPLR